MDKRFCIVFAHYCFLFYNISHSVVTYQCLAFSAREETGVQSNSRPWTDGILEYFGQMHWQFGRRPDSHFSRQLSNPGISPFG